MSYALTYPDGQSPVAIIVQASVPEIAGAEEIAAHDLSGLKEEADSIADLLHGAGYDVHVAASGLYSEVSRLLSDSDICRRLVVFHYCGHANLQNVAMYRDNGTRLEVSAEGLAQQMAAMSKALRLVYMNGCETETQEAVFRNSFPNVNFIGTRLKVEDWFSKKLALSIYRRLVGNADAPGTTTIDQAITGAMGEDMGYHPQRIDLTMRLTIDHEASALARLPDLNFRLSDGPGLISDYLHRARQLRPPSTILAYCSIVLALQTLFLWCAHLWSATSSPAFQAAFVYTPTCETLAHMVQTAGGLFPGSGPSVAAVLAAWPMPDLTGCPPGDGFQLGLVSVGFGFWVEWGRALVLCMLLTLIWVMIYRHVPRGYPNQRFSRLQSAGQELRRWRRLEKNALFYWVFIVGSVAVILYHVILAHGTLAHVTQGADVFSGMTWMQARWSFYLGDDSIWQVFAANSTLAALLALEPEARRAALADLSVFDPAYWALYVRPYLFYMGYSLVNYLAIALPILAVIVNGLRFSRRQFRARLQGLEVDLRMTRDGYRKSANYLIRRLSTLKEDMSATLDRFVALFACIVIFYAFEVLLGRATTALFSQIIMALVLAFVVFGAATILNVWNGYRDGLQTMRLMVDDVEDDAVAEALAPFGDALEASVLPLKTSALLIFASLVAVTLYLSALLINRHWTIFTHPLWPF